jgi:hypothetical protein
MEDVASGAPSGFDGVVTLRISNMICFYQFIIKEYQELKMSTSRGVLSHHQGHVSCVR